MTELLEQILAELKAMNERLDTLLAFESLALEEEEEIETYMDGTPV